MRTKEQLLRFIDAQVSDRQAGGYADISLPVQEIEAHHLGVDEIPWWASIRVTNGEAGALHLPATFVPERDTSDWSVEVEHVVDPEAWAALDPAGDYTDALAAELVDEVASLEELTFEGVDGPFEGDDGSEGEDDGEGDGSFTVLYRLRAATGDLADAVRSVTSLDESVRATLQEEAADSDALYPEL